MRRLVTWLVVSLGIAAIIRRLRRRSPPAESVESTPEPTAEADAEDDPADELRRKLAESRGDPPPTEPPPAAEATVEERRASVHDEGRSTVDEMRGADEG